ncbi:MAG: D-alanyl-D-alanine carboxypeptidase [Deltaproteobacteria bacterium]|nr:D-alanyl-D-alanine carboxypeptidase [Deltaproteobacteria bacterium]
MRRHWLGARYWAAICAVVAVLGGMAFAAFAQDDGEGPEKVREKVRFLLKSPVLHGAKVGILAKSLATGEVLYRRDADQPLIPASTNKLVTGAAALDILGPKYKFKTEVYVDPPMGGDGGVAGNLYVKGYGDPSITVEEAWLLAHQIYGHGVRAVAGDLIGDDSFFEPVRFYESWGFKTPRSYSAPMGALSFNWNTLQAYVAPATAAGQPAHVTLNPEGDYYTLDNRVVTCEQCRTILSLALGTRSAVVSGKNRRGIGADDDVRVGARSAAAGAVVDEKPA